MQWMMKMRDRKRGFWPTKMRIAQLALLGGALFASSARGAGDEAFDGSGEAVVPGGGTVSFTGASSTNWVDGELVLVYTNAATFTLPGTTKARVLAVGGGGGKLAQTGLRTGCCIAYRMAWSDNGEGCFV